MTKYYIRVSDEEPLEDDEALYFVLESAEGEDDKLFVLHENPYNSLVQTFELVKTNMEQVISDGVDDAIDVALQGITVQYSTNAKNLKDTDSDDKFTYDSLSTALSNLNGSKANKIETNNAITNINNNINSLNSNKSNINHTHKKWVKVTASNYGHVYYNADLQMCFFRYYRGSDAQYNITKTWTTYNIYTMGDSRYFPIETTHLNFFNPNQYGYMNNKGELYIGNKEVTGKQNVNISGFWICKGATTN